MKEDWEGEEVLDIDDPIVPEEICEFGRRVRDPARYVIDLGGRTNTSCMGADGELLDMVALRT